SRLEFSYSSSWRGGTGKLNRRSRGGGKSGNPAAVAGFPSAVGKSRLGTFPRSGVFHGPFTHKLCYRSFYLLGCVTKDTLRASIPGGDESLVCGTENGII